nr:Gfo/Idh/MocA family oxidoreductase [Candidatus Sigynarchaeota archaeon]
MDCRLGILGFGFMGKTHALNAKAIPGVKVTAIFSVEKDKAEIEQLGAKFYADWQKMLDTEKIDAIVVATPTFTHGEMALTAISKGMHVFLEKPMERTIKKCKEINVAAKKKGVLLGMGHVLRFDGEYMTIKDQVASGAIGHAKMARCTRRGPPPGWSTWFFDEEKSGGAILDLSIHDIDFICWLASKAPKRVAAMASPIVLGGKTLFGISHVVLDFEPGPGIELGFAEASWGAVAPYPFSTAIEVAGKDGLIACHIPGKHPMETYSASGCVTLNLYAHDGYYNEINDFIDAIKERRPPKVTGDDGMLAVRVCLAALESARSRNVIDVEGFA